MEDGRSSDTKEPADQDHGNHSDSTPSTEVVSATSVDDAVAVAGSFQIVPRNPIDNSESKDADLSYSHLIVVNETSDESVAAKGGSDNVDNEQTQSTCEESWMDAVPDALAEVVPASHESGSHQISDLEPECDGSSSLQLLTHLEDTLSSDTEDAFSECPEDIAESLYADLVASDGGVTSGQPVDQRGQSATVPDFQRRPATPVEILRGQLMRPAQLVTGGANWSDRGRECLQFWAELAQQQQQSSIQQPATAMLSDRAGGDIGTELVAPSQFQYARNRTIHSGLEDALQAVGNRQEPGVATHQLQQQQLLQHKFMSHPGFFYDSATYGSIIGQQSLRQQAEQHLQYSPWSAPTVGNQYGHLQHQRPEFGSVAYPRSVSNVVPPSASYVWSPSANAFVMPDFAIQQMAQPMATAANQAPEYQEGCSSNVQTMGLGHGHHQHLPPTSIGTGGWYGWPAFYPSGVPTNLEELASSYEPSIFDGSGSSSHPSSMSGALNSAGNSIRSPSLDTPPPLNFQSPSPPPPRHVDHSTMPDLSLHHQHIHPYYGLFDHGHHHQQQQQQQHQQQLQQQQQQQQQPSLTTMSTNDPSSYFQQWVDDGFQSTVLDMRMAKPEAVNEARSSTTVGFSAAEQTEKQHQQQYHHQQQQQQYHQHQPSVVAQTSADYGSVETPVGTGSVAVCRSPCTLCLKSVPRFQINPSVPRDQAPVSTASLPTFASQFPHGRFPSMPAAVSTAPSSTAAATTNTTTTTVSSKSVGHRETVNPPYPTTRPSEITVRQMLMNRGRQPLLPGPPPRMAGIRSLRYQLAPPPRFPNSAVSVLPAVSAASTLPPRLPRGRPPNAARYVAADMSFVLSTVGIPQQLQFSDGGGSSSRSVLKSASGPTELQPRPSSDAPPIDVKCPQPLFQVSVVSGSRNVLPEYGVMPPAVSSPSGSSASGRGSKTTPPKSSLLTNALLAPGARVFGVENNQLRKLLCQKTEERPTTAKKRGEDMRKTRSMITSTIAIAKTPLISTPSVVPNRPLKLEMPHLLPAGTTVPCKVDCTDNRPPRHYDMETLQIGTFKVNRQPRCKNRNKLKLYFSKRKLVYEFSVEDWQLPLEINPTMVPYMAVLDVPLASVTAIHCSEMTLMIAVNEAPSLYLGGRPTRTGAGVNFDRSRPCDVTNGQLNTCHIHKIWLKKKQIDAFRYHLERFDEKLKPLFTAPMFEDVQDLTNPLTMEMPNKRKTLADEEFAAPSVKRHCVIDVSPPPTTSSIKVRKDVAAGTSCQCHVSCRSNRCSCMKSKSKCGVGATACQCRNCDNPLNLMESMGIDLEGVLQDVCLMQSIIVHRGDISELLETKVFMPCCLAQFPLWQCIPGRVRCPNVDCLTGASYKFSWCSLALCDQESSPRNHCSACKSCREPIDLHCSVCRRCSPVDGSSTKCSSCGTSRDSTFTEQGTVSTVLIERLRRIQKMPVLVPATTADSDVVPVGSVEHEATDDVQLLGVVDGSGAGVRAEVGGGGGGNGSGGDANHHDVKEECVTEVYEDSVAASVRARIRTGSGRAARDRRVHVVDVDDGERRPAKRRSNAGRPRTRNR